MNKKNIISFISHNMTNIRNLLNKSSGMFWYYLLEQVGE